MRCSVPPPTAPRCASRRRGDSARPRCSMPTSSRCARSDIARSESISRGSRPWRTPPPAWRERSRRCPATRVAASVAEAGGGLTVVCLDEFQDLLVSDEALDGVVRSVIQHHGEAAAYVFAGSQPSLMRSLFSDQERPFYGQARPLELPPLPIDEAAADIARLLEADGLFERAGGAVD